MNSFTYISPLTLTSKISEYIAIGKPIFSICNDNSPIYRILKETNYIVSLYKKEQIKKSILSTLTNSKTISLINTVYYKLTL